MCDFHPGSYTMIYRACRCGAMLKGSEATSGKSESELCGRDRPQPSWS